MKYLCSHCKKWFDNPDRTPRHTIMRGTDLFVCNGSGKPPRSSRPVYEEVAEW